MANYKKTLRTMLYYLLIACLVIQCKDVEDNQTESSWLNTQKSKHYSSYAKYIQEHPKSKHFEQALSKYFYLKDSIADYLGCGKYNASISIYNDKHVLFNDKLTALDSLNDVVFEYLINGVPNAFSSLNYEIQIPKTNLKDSISKGHFDIVIYKKPFPIKYLKIALEEVNIGINNYNEYLSKKWYKTPYFELPNKTKMEFDKLNYTRLSFFDFSNLKGEKFFQPPKRSINISDDEKR